MSAPRASSVLSFLRAASTFKVKRAVSLLPRVRVKPSAAEDSQGDFGAAGAAAAASSARTDAVKVNASAAVKASPAHLDIIAIFMIWVGHCSDKAALHKEGKAY